MRFFKDNLLLLTLCFLAVLTTLNSKNVVAGGDPSIKDKKVSQKKSKSDITQHDHAKTYVNKQKKLSSKKNEEKSKSSIK